MLVVVVRMRDRGKKIAPEALKSTPPREGWLHINTVPWRPHWRPELPAEPLTIAKLTELRSDDSRLVFPQLLAVRVRHLKGFAFTLVGAEMLTHRDHPQEFPQAWWVRLAHPPTIRERGPVIDEARALLQEWDA